MKCELLITNGIIIDGTGRPAYNGDLAVNKGKIIAISPLINCQADRIINAAGLTVCPGFIDPHVHEELTVLQSSIFEEYLRQGVTTIINGNCGHSITPYSADNIYSYMVKKGLISHQTKERNKLNVPSWTNFSGYIDIVKNKGSNLNMGFLLGHGTIKWSIMGDTKNRKMSGKEETKIVSLLEEGMEQGALGLSTGLTYSPSKYADTDEIVKCAKVVQKYDGIYTSHIRSYLGTLEAVKEAIQIGTAAGIRVQVSHLTPNCPEGFDEILNARQNGLEIAVDTIPKSSGHFRRKDRLFQYLTTKEFLTSEEKQRLVKRLYSKENLALVNTGIPNLENRTLKEIALERMISVDELILELLNNDRKEITFCQGGLIRKDFPGTPYAENIAQNPYLMVGSDKVNGEIDDPFAWYELYRKGAFPIFINLCRESGIKLEEIIRRITSLPAEHFRFSNRGTLSPGKAADITIIDINNYNYPTDNEIDYKTPLTECKGVKYTIVNGRVALNDGIIEHTNSGQLLSRNSQVL
ncbi:N-acyl-D-amino-acid deacylase family protein [Desulfosporosinus meridiei]|uniref:N-acyl-D-aspartate/D-glutamate deacylase n=1 Tax=Desulfosporosinus meridiei (strain ATCC BAA-275 / DSM 13257 / KCTC 12902 / NCIMB 13706 / S10) TaxID=768704 RepID=J7J176_DESMD|nr:amidohydrolase family protein [Desulfosporosinus meridiei]AFQ44711.1 N-acyl-D-aspartate/D-glutamate deacylase [Desulfosporosinus meridiei DSM 13257]